jgi:hypothetical protein
VKALLQFISILDFWQGQQGLLWHCICVPATFQSIVNGKYEEWSTTKPL